MCPSLLSHYKGVIRMKTLEIRTDILIKVFLTVILIFGLTSTHALSNVVLIAIINKSLR
jgi:hypothetical protein